MDEFTFTTLSFTLAAAEEQQPHTLSSSEASAASTSSYLTQLDLPPVDQEVIDGNGSYSWCTIA